MLPGTVKKEGTMRLFVVIDLRIGKERLRPHLSRRRRARQAAAMPAATPNASGGNGPIAI